MTNGADHEAGRGRRIAWHIHSFGKVGSTNDVARRIAQGGAAEGTVVLAETQASGRGRRGSAWHSPPGGLWFSIVLKPHLPAERAGGLSIVGALSVARAVADVAGIDASIKWPNDVVVDGRKLAGIMLETAGNGVLIMGVGLNANVAPEDLPKLEWYEATSLLRETGRTFVRGALLARIAREFERRYFLYRSPEHHELVEEWRELSVIFGQQVRVTARGRTLEGTVHALDDDGGIIVRLPAGAQEKVLPVGDVTLMILPGT